MFMVNPRARGANVQTLTWSMSLSDSETPSPAGGGSWLARLPWWLPVLGSLTLGLAPFVPEPHLVEKLRMLAQGTLQRPVDIFDLVLHAAFPALLLAKAGDALVRRLRARP
jgi:hypothetical protein